MAIKTHAKFNRIIVTLMWCPGHLDFFSKDKERLLCFCVQGVNKDINFYF